VPLPADLPDMDLLSEGQVGSPRRLERLIARFIELQHRVENESRRALWLVETCARDQWHGTPLPDRFRSEGIIPFTVDLQYPIWQRLWPMYDLQAVFTNPRAFLDFQLTRKIAQFQWLPDDTYLDNNIFIYLGTPFEPSLFGMKVRYFADGNPALLHEPVIKSCEDLIDRPPPDFYQSGLMPVAHRMWSEIGDILQGRINLQFVEWLRSPFGIATDIRGFGPLLVDMMTDPGFFHALMDYIVQSQVAWYDEWSKFVGRRPEGVSIFNDEVDGSILSADHYLNNIHQHEVRLNEAFGLVTYYHSCGNLTPMMPHIDTLPNIRMLDLGPYTDKKMALRSLKRQYLFELRVQPERDLLQASGAEMRRALEQHVATCKQFDVGAVTFRASGMQPIFPDPLDVIAKIREWVNTMRDIAIREAEAGGHQSLLAAKGD
jgi:uroporphyrinogen-III decarboxylase